MLPVPIQFEILASLSRTSQPFRSLETTTFPPAYCGASSKDHPSFIALNWHFGGVAQAASSRSETWQTPCGERAMSLHSLLRYLCSGSAHEDGTIPGSCPLHLINSISW